MVSGVSILAVTTRSQEAQILLQQILVVRLGQPSILKSACQESCLDPPLLLHSYSSFCDGRLVEMSNLLVNKSFICLPGVVQL